MAISFKYYKIKQPTLNLDLSFEASATSTTTTTNNKGELQLSQERMKILMAIMGIIETPTIDVGQRLQGQQQYAGQPETTTCWLHNSEGSPQGCTFQHECSFVKVDMHELYSIHVIQHITFI
jgi:hypothetical protein